jgi:hypothetical protein
MVFSSDFRLTADLRDNIQTTRVAPIRKLVRISRYVYKSTLHRPALGAVIRINISVLSSQYPNPEISDKSCNLLACLVPTGPSYKQKMTHYISYYL